MPTEFYEVSPHHLLRCQWPQTFTERQPFNDFRRQSENRPYVVFARTERFHGEEDEVVKSDEEYEGSGDVEEEGADNEGDEDEDEDEDLNQDDELTSGKSVVRLFMEGMTGDEETLLDHDQVEQVVSFYEQGNLRILETNVGQGRKSVALLDDRNICGAVHTNCGSSPCPGHSRPYLGPLTPERLSKELERKRFKLKSDQDVASYVPESLDCDAERRTIFVAGLDSSTVAILAQTATLFQTPALRDLLYKHLTDKTSIGVTIPSSGLPTFTLECHIPYFALRESKELLKDARMKLGGEPLRESWKLPSLSSQLNPPASLGEIPCLYEAQMSVVVTGTSDWVWVAYGFFDVYFESKDVVASYQRLNGTKGHRKGRADFLTAGRLNAEEPIWMPREYFFKVFAIRMKLVLREWNGISNWIEQEVKQSRIHPVDLLPPGGLKLEQLRKLRHWNHQMVNILGDLKGRLSDTVRAWTDFRRSEIGYFQDDTEPPNASSQLKLSITAVDKAFSSLNALLPKLKDLEQKLRNESPQGINGYLSIESHNAAISQLENGRHVQVLTFVGLAFLPLVLGGSLFSAPGVLPFTPNFGRFLLVLIPLAILVGTTAVVFFRWHSWLPGIIEFTIRVRNSMIAFRKQKSKEETSDDANTSPRSRYWSFLFPRIRDVGDQELEDLEMQRERQRHGESHQI